jgi:hypothetical protein
VTQTQALDVSDRHALLPDAGSSSLPLLVPKPASVTNHCHDF